jgi:hypothetical protein
VRVAVRVRSLHREHRDVRRDGRDQQQRRSVDRRGRREERSVGARDVAAEQRARGQVRRAERAGEERLSEREVAVITDLDAPRYPLLERAPVGVRQAGRNVADPRRRDAPRAARADELIERDVGDRSDELELASLLSDELVREREGDRRLERATERDGRAVGDEARDRLRQADTLVRDQPPCSSIPLLLAHLPLNSGLRFSTKAFTPSRASSLLNRRISASRSILSPSSSGRP